MRIFLFGQPSTRLQQSAVRLSFSGYNCNYFQERPSIGAPSEAKYRERLVNAMLWAQAVVVHDQLSEGELHRLAVVSEFIGRPLTHLRDLPEWAPEHPGDLLVIIIARNSVPFDPLDDKIGLMAMRSVKMRARIRRAIQRAPEVLHHIRERMRRGERAINGKLTQWLPKNAMSKELQGRS